MSAAFTSGPWAWDETTDKYSRYRLPRLVSPAGEVCNFGDSAQFYPTEGEAPSPADQRLIAAAPELFEACRAMLAERSAVAQLSDACQLGIAALAKALGEPQ